VIDPELVHRAEQAYLGAILARHGRVGTGTAVAGEAGQAGFAGLRAEDFTDPVHQAIYAVLAGQAVPRPGGLYERLRGLLTRLFSRRARDAAAYMAELPDRCPDPANLPAYAAMVTDASQQRASHARARAELDDRGHASRPRAAAGRAPEPAAAENPRLASAAEWLDGTRPGPRTAGRRPAAAAPDALMSNVPASSRAARTDHAAASGLAPDAARLARALRAEARAATRVTPGTARLLVPPESPRAPLGLEALQDQVLADLMRRPADGSRVTAWLPAQVFTPGPRRDLYELISRRLGAGRPVDPLIMAWEASALAGPAAEREIGAGQSPAGTVLRLGALDPAPGTAAVLGQALYADHVCTESFGPGWPRAPRLSPVTTGARAGHSDGIEPATAAEASPSPRPVTEPGPSPEVVAEPAAGPVPPLPRRHPRPINPLPFPQPPARVPGVSARTQQV
jgi:hypothetical protein